MYLAIIGDLVNSRRMSSSEHSRVHKALKAALADINQDFKADIAADFLITLGDEFQGLLKRSDKLMIIMERITSALEGHDARFGLGIGSVPAAPESDIRGENSPAFLMARKALDTIKHNSRRSEQPKTLARLESEAINTELINHMFTQLYYQTVSWTDKQRQIVWLKRNTFSQKELAEQLGVSQPYINQVLQATGYYTYRASLQGIIKDINRQLYG